MPFLIVTADVVVANAPYVFAASHYLLGSHLKTIQQLLPLPHEEAIRPSENS